MHFTALYMQAMCCANFDYLALSSALWQCTVQCSAHPDNGCAVQQALAHCAVCTQLPCNSTALCSTNDSTALNSTVMYTNEHCTVLYSAVQYNNVHCIALKMNVIGSRGELGIMECFVKPHFPL